MKKVIGKGSSKFLRIIAVCSAVLLILVLIHTMIITNLIRRRIEVHFSRALGMTVHVGGMETDLFTRIQIRDIDVCHRDGTPFLTLKYGRANYRIWNFLKHDVLIRAVRIDSLFISVKRDSSALPALPFLLSGEDSSNAVMSAPWRIRIRNINIQHSMIAYDDRQIPLHGAVYGIGVECEHQEKDVYHWAASSDSARFISGGKNLPVVQLNAAGMIGPECWDVRNLEIKTPGLALSGQASGELKGRYSTLQGAFSMEGSAADWLHAMLPESVSPAEGDLDATLLLGGNWADPQCTVEVRVRNARLGDMIIPGGHIRTVWRDSLLILENLEIALLGGRISGDGYMAMDSLMDHRLSLNAQGIELPDLLKTIYQDSVTTEGVVSGRWISSGPVKSFREVRVESRLDVIQARYRNRTLPDLSMRLSAEAGTTDLLFTQGENRFEGDLQINGVHGEGNFRYTIQRIGPLAELMNIENFSGSFHGSGRIFGDIKNPEISMEIRGENLRYQNFPIDSLQLDAEYRDGHVVIKNGAFSGQVVSRESPRTLFNSALFQGDILYRGIISGTLENPQGEIQAKFFKPEFGDFCFDEGDLRITALQGQIYLDTLTLRKDSLFVRAKGKFRIPSMEGRLDVSVLESLKNEQNAFTEIEGVLQPVSGSRRFGSITAYFDQELNKGWRLKADGENIRLDKLLSFYRKKTDWTGKFGFDLSLSGIHHEHRGLLQIRADSVGTYQTVLDSVRGTFQLREHHITASPLEFHAGGRRSSTEADFELMRTKSGGYTLTDESQIEGRSEGSGIDCRFFAPLFGRGVELSGIGDYELECKGHWGRPRIRGQLSVTNGLVRIGSGTDPIQSIEARLSLIDSLLQIGPVSGTIRDIPFRMEGRAIHRNWRNFQMDAKLDVSGVETLALDGTKTADSLDFRMGIHDLNLSLFHDFMADIGRLEGRLNSQIKVSGSVESPRFFGFLEAGNVLMHPKALDCPLSEGIIKATFANDTIVLDTLYFRMNGGTVLAGGNTIISGREIINLNGRIAVDHVNIVRPKAFSLAIQSVRAGIGKERDDFYIRGDVILDESRLIQNVQPGALLPFLQKVERPMTTPSSFLRKTHIDLHVRESDKLWIDNNIARLRLHSELGIIGTLARPNLSGRLSVEEGYVLYLDRKFRVQYSVLDFMDPNRINPMVDFKAQADIKGYQTWSRQPYTVSLGIQGLLDQAVMDLSSSPPLDRADIITLLTMGATREQLTSRNDAGKSSIGFVLEERVGYLSSRQISGFAGRRIGNLLGLKEMTIEGNLFRFGKSWGPQLLASKKITDRMAISYTTRVGHANEQSIRLDYRLSKILSIEGQTDQQGRSGIDLKFRWKFK